MTSTNASRGITLSVMLISLFCLLGGCKKDNLKEEDWKNSIDTLTESRYFDVDWDSNNYEYDVKRGILLAKLNASIPPINSAFLALDDEECPIRVVNSVKKSGNGFEVLTESGTFENLFQDQSFTLSTDPNAATKYSSSNRDVFFPSKVVIHYSDSTERACTKAIVFPGINHENLQLLDVSLKDCSFSFGLDLSMSFDFGKQEVNGLSIGKLNGLRIKLTPSLSFDTVLQIKFEDNHPNTPISIPLSKATLFEYTFIVYGVPIVVSIDPEFDLSYSVTAKSRFVWNLGTQVSLDGEIGYDWNRSLGISSFSSIKPSFTLDTWHDAFDSIYLEPGFPFSIPISLYHTVSLFVSYGPELQYSFSKHVFPTGEKSTSESIFRQFKLSCGLRLSLLTKYNSSFETSIDKIFNRDTVLFMPRTITQLSPESPYYCDRGESIRADYCVEGYKRFRGGIVKVDGALVHFRAIKGSTSSEYVYSNDNGDISVEYMLGDSEKEGAIIAELLDGDGGVVQADTVKVFLRSPDIPDEPDDYVPTEEDCKIYYRRILFDPDVDGIQGHISQFDPGNVVCGNLVLDHKEFRDDNCSGQEIAGEICLDAPVLTIPEKEFMSMQNLMYFRIPNSCKEVAEESFYTSSITGTMIIPDHVTSIGKHAFALTGINTVVFGRRVKTIDMFAFWGTHLNAMPSFPQSLREIGGYAFSSTEIDGDLILPEGLNRIGANAFEGCHKIRTARLPSSLTELEPGIFHDCKGLEIIYAPAELAGKQFLVGGQNVDLRFYLLLENNDTVKIVTY